MFLPRIPLSSNGYTYVFVPRDFLQGLFGMYSQDLPTTFTDPGFGALGPGDTIPSNINLSTISFLGGFLLTLLSVFTSDPHTSEGAGQRRGF